MNDLNTCQEQLAKTTNETLKKLDSIRQQIVDCDDECDWLRSAPLPLDDALGNIDRFIKENNEVPGITQFFHDLKLVDKPFNVQARQAGVGRLNVENGVVIGSLGYTVDVSVLFCGLFPELVKTALVEQVTRESKNVEAGPPRAERAGLIRAAKQRCRALEVEEEALISQAEEAGLTGFYRRSDCNPEIVLMRAK
jgi:hypothetical protein